MSGNELHRIPDCVRRLSSLDDTTKRTIPDKFSRLAKLQKLNVENNLRLEYIPPVLMYITEYDNLVYEQTTRAEEATSRKDKLRNDWFGRAAHWAPKMGVL